MLIQFQKGRVDNPSVWLFPTHDKHEFKQGFIRDFTPVQSVVAFENEFF